MSGSVRKKRKSCREGNGERQGDVSWSERQGRKRSDEEGAREASVTGAADRGHTDGQLWLLQESDRFT